MEAEILLWIQENLRMSGLNSLMKGITHLGDLGIVWILAAILLMLYPERRRVGYMVMVGMLISYLFNNLFLKSIVARTRPYEVVRGLELLVGKAKDMSFPSGHSATSFVAAVIIAGMVGERYGVMAVILAALISFSRLYVGIHYPTDVLFGIVSGSLIGMGIVVFAKYLQGRTAIKSSQEA